MIQVGIAVEGETEEDFVKKVLRGHFNPSHFYLHPVLPAGRGGNISVPRLASAMRRLLQNFHAVTSLVDFYGFKNKGGATPKDLERQVLEAMSRTMSRPPSERRVFPYVQRHEFEGLLFSDVGGFRSIRPFSDLDEKKLLGIRQQFATPEEIDDGPDTAPSKRLTGLLPRYDKREHGPLVAEAIGIARIRAECPRFDGWLKKIESLPTVPDR